MYFRELTTAMEQAKWLLDAEEWDGIWEQNLVSFVNEGGLRELYKLAWQYQDLASS